MRYFQDLARAKAVKEDRSWDEAQRGGVKVPWKKVSERIREMGGTYLFAPATCAKKWVEGGWS